MVSDDVRGDLAQYARVDDEQYRAYLAQRAGSGTEWHFVWVDSRWPSCAAIRYAEGATAPARPVVVPTLVTLYDSNPWLPDLPVETWVRYLARISYCAEICLHPDEAVDAVLYAEVGEVTGPRADELRPRLEHAVRVLRMAGMLAPEFNLMVPR